MKKTLTCTLFFVLVPFLGLAQNQGSKNVRIRVVSPTEVLVSLEDMAWPNGSEYGRSDAFQLLEVPDGWNQDPRVRASDVNIGGVKGELLQEGFFLKVSGLPLAKGKRYFLVVRDVQSGRDIGRGLFSTKAEAKIVPTGAAADRRRVVRIVSEVEFDVSADTLQEIYQKKLKKEDGSQTPERRITHPARVARPVNHPDDPDTRGVAEVTLRENDRLWSRKPTLRVAGLRDVFQQAVTAEGEIELGAAPVGKDDASFYVKIGNDAGKRAFPSYSIEAKAKPQAGWVGDFVFYPAIDVDIAKNVANSANSMNFSGLFNYKKPTASSVFQTLAFEFGGTFETDRDFDTTNLLGSFVFSPRIAKLYRPRDLATWQRFSRLFQQGKAAKLEEVDPVDFGFGLEIFLGVEGGSSLQDRSVQNPPKTATLEIPRYGILRLRPSLHLFLEYKQVTLDVSSALRWLASEEFSARLLPNKSLQLRSVDGFRAYTTTSLSYRLDRNGRIALVVQYKNGSAPPLFSNVNKVTSGIEFKY